MSARFEFTITNNEGGGDCLFRSIASYIDNSENKHAEVRRRVCEYIQQNWKDYMAEIIIQHQEEVKYLSRMKSKMEEMTAEEINKSMYEYLDYMKKKGSYGTITELFAAAKLFEFNCSAIQERNKDALVSPIFISKNYRWGYFLFTGNFRRGHWRMVTPVPDQIYLPECTCKHQKSNKKGVYTMTYNQPENGWIPKSATDGRKQASLKRKAEGPIEFAKPAKMIHVVDRPDSSMWKRLGFKKEEDFENLEYDDFGNEKGIFLTGLQHQGEWAIIVKLSPGAMCCYDNKAQRNMILKGDVFFVSILANTRTYRTELLVKKDENYRFRNQSEDQVA